MELPTRDTVRRTVCRIGRDGKGFCERSGPEGTARIPVERNGDIISPARGRSEGSNDALVKLYEDFHNRRFDVKESD